MREAHVSPPVEPEQLEAMGMGGMMDPNAPRSMGSSLPRMITWGLPVRRHIASAMNPPADS